MANLTTEFKNELQAGLERSKDYLERLTFQKEMYRNSILSHNYVISVGGVLTIGLKKDGSKILDYRFQELPSLWTKEGAESNKKALQENDDREILIIGKHTWYANEIKKVKSMINSVETILNK
jgi:hypothetical protein